MKTRKITLAIVIVFAACIFQACNSKNDKNSMGTENGRLEPNSSSSGNDSSHTTDNRRNEAGGIDTKPAGVAASGNTNANGTVTAQGMTGADSAYQKKSQKPSN